MRQKLLHKTLKVYIIFSVAILAITGPVFYFFAEKVQYNEAEEALRLRQHEFENLRLPTFKQYDIAKWNNWSRDLKIEPVDTLLSSPQFSSGYYINMMDNDLEPYYTLRAPIFIENKPYTLFIKINMLENEHMIINLLGLYIVIILLLLTGLYFITKILSTLLWKPFTDLLTQLEYFEINNPVSIHYPATTTDEFIRLNTIVEQLIGRNILIYNSQKEFIENASHELQTPLAIMQAKLDNLIQSDSLNPELAGELETLNNALSRLGRINKNLLLLSRIDADNYPFKQTVFVNEIIHQQLHFFENQYLEKDITVTANITENLAVTANPTLFEICTSNLLMNAIKHTANGGSIVITIQSNTLSIANTAAYGQLPPQNLFKRFAKINLQSQGAGLGLAIVKKVTELNQWQLAYNFTNSMHNFTITF